MSWRSQSDARWKAFAQENIRLVDALEARLHRLQERALFDDCSGLLADFTDVLSRSSLPRKTRQLALNMLHELTERATEVAHIVKTYEFAAHMAGSLIYFDLQWGIDPLRLKAGAIFAREASTATTTARLLELWRCTDHEHLWRANRHELERLIVRRLVELAKTQDEIKTVMDFWGESKRSLEYTKRNRTWDSRWRAMRLELIIEMIPGVLEERLNK